MFTPSSGKYLGIRKFDFVRKTQLIQILSQLKFERSKKKLEKKKSSSEKMYNLSRRSVSSLYFMLDFKVELEDLSEICQIFIK